MNLQLRSVVKKYKYKISQSRLIHGSFWSFFGTFFNQGSTFVNNIIIAHIFGKQIFGDYAIIQNTLVIGSQLAQVALGYTITKYLAEYRNSNPQKAERIFNLCWISVLFFSIFSSIIFFFLIPFLSENMLGSSRLSGLFFIGIGYIFFTSLNSFLSGVLSGLEKFRYLGYVGCINGITYLGIISIAAYKGALVGSIIGLSITAFINFLIYTYFVWKGLLENNIKITIKNILSERQIFYKFTLPAIISGYIAFPSVWLGNSFLYNQPGGAMQMGDYTAANNIRLIGFLLPNIINTVGLSLINNDKSFSKKRYLNTFKNNLFIITSMTIFVIIIIFIFGDLLLSLFGKDFNSDLRVLWVLIISLLPECISLVLLQNLQSNEKMWNYFFGIVLPREVIFILLSFNFARNYGAYGLGLSYLISRVLGMLTSLLLVYFYYKKDNLMTYER